MEKISFRAYKESDFSELCVMSTELYLVDPSDKTITSENIRNTVESSVTNPELIQIVLFDLSGVITGYSITIKYWSNEYGGFIEYIDELFVKEKYRSQGIGSSYIKFLKENHDENVIALRLEVTPDNAKARKLYQRNGFLNHKNKTLDLLLKK